MISALLFLTAGAGLFFLLLNRLVIRLKDSKLKKCLIALTGLSLTVGPALCGYRVEDSGWRLLPILVLAGFLAGELRRAVLRRRCRGTPPIEWQNVRIALTRPCTTTALMVTRYAIQRPDWHGRRLRIAHLSDLHVSDQYPAAFYAEIISRIHAAAPDLLFITGDFVSEAHFAPRLPAILTPLTARYRTFGVLGNHDYWAGAEEIAQVVRAAGVHLLGNACHQIRHDGRQPLLIYGDEAPWGAAHPPIENAPPDALRLALTHTPDNIYRLNADGAHAVFAGHYHAGQFRLPYLGAIVIPSAYGRRFDHGHFLVQGTHLFVTSGIGGGTPLRLYCPPDIFIIDVSHVTHHPPQSPRERGEALSGTNTVRTNVSPRLRGEQGGWGA